MNKCPTFHAHKFYEFEYVVSGIGTHYINNMKYDISAGDFFGTSPVDYHRYENTDVVINNLIISYPHTTEDIKSIIDGISFPMYGRMKEESHKRSCVLFNALTDILTSESVYRNNKITGITSALLWEYCENSQPIIEPGICTKRYTTVHYAVEYINLHFNEHITLDTITDHLNVSPFYLSRFFKLYTGYSFTDYLNMTRLNHACRLLVETDISVFDVSVESGFGCPSNMNRIFSRFLLTTPRDYRNNIAPEKL